MTNHETGDSVPKWSIDRFDATIAGWVYIPDNPSIPPKLAAYANGEKIAEFYADLYREDLLTAIPIATRAFSKNIEEHVRAMGAVEVSLRVIEPIEFELACKIIHLKPRYFVGGLGYRFLANDSNNTDNILTNGSDIDPRANFRDVSAILARTVFFEKLKIKYIHIVIPDKSVILRELRGEKFIISESRPVNIQQKAAVDLGLTNFHYPIKLLRELRMDAFPKSDTHITHRAMCCVIKSLSDDILSVAASSWIQLFEVEKEFRGDLCDRDENFNEAIEMAKLNGEIVVENDDVEFRLENRMSLEGGEASLSNGRAPLGKLHLCGTSSAYYGLKIFASLFKNTRFKWGVGLNLKEIAANRPDFVIFVTTERFIPMRSGDCW